MVLKGKNHPTYDKNNSQRKTPRNEVVPVLTADLLRKKGTSTPPVPIYRSAPKSQEISGSKAQAGKLPFSRSLTPWRRGPGRRTRLRTAPAADSAQRQGHRPLPDLLFSEVDQPKLEIEDSRHQHGWTDPCSEGCSEIPQYKTALAGFFRLTGPQPQIVAAPRPNQIRSSARGNEAPHGRGCGDRADGRCPGASTWRQG